MKNYVVESYENYREEERLSTNNARRLEFLTTVRALDELVVGKKKILDCVAGTGVYVFFLQIKDMMLLLQILPQDILKLSRK